MKSRSDHQHRLTAARDAVVEAAERWVDAHDALRMDDALAAGDDIDAAVANLHAVRKEMGNG